MNVPEENRKAIQVTAKDEPETKKRIAQLHTRILGG
jgi:hypothetical protein